MAMIRDNENKENEKKKNSGGSDSEDKRSSASSIQSESSSSLTLSSQLSVNAEECEMNSEFRIVRLKRPNATAIGGTMSKRRKPNYSEDCKSPELYSLNSGVLKKIFEGKLSDNEPIMVQVSYYLLTSLFFYSRSKTVFFLDDHEGEDEGKQASSLSLRWKVHYGKMCFDS